MSDYSNAKYLERIEAQKRSKLEKERLRRLDILRLKARDPKWYEETVASETLDKWVE